MQLNPGSSAGLVDDVHFLCQTDAVGYPLADMIRNMNRHYNKAVIDILKTEGRLQFDDSTNIGNLPQYTFTLVDGQAQYSLPTNLLKLWAIEVADAQGNFYRLKELDLRDPEFDRTITGFQETDGLPKFYDVRGENLFMSPAVRAADVTTTNGGKMYFAREVDPFTTADTDQEPGFAEPFHRILSLGASYDWLVVNDTSSKADRVLSQYEQLRMELRQFYSTKSKDTRVGITRRDHSQHDFL